MPMTPYIGNANAPTGASSGKPILVDIQGMPDPSAATDGQLFIGDTGVGMVLATLTAGAGISVTNAAGGITIASTASGSPTLETPAGAINGINNTFDLSGVPSFVLFFLNGLLLRQGTDFAIVGDDCVLGAGNIPQTGDNVFAAWWA